MILGVDDYQEVCDGTHFGKDSEYQCIFACSQLFITERYVFFACIVKPIDFDNMIRKSVNIFLH